MALGMEMMLKSLGLDPEKITQAVAGIGQIMADSKAQLDRIEHKQNLILQHLGIEIPGQKEIEAHNGRKQN